MLRWLISIVFCISIIMGSTAHASMMPGSQSHLAPVEQSAPTTTCWKKMAQQLAPAKMDCLHMATTKTGGQRCQVDVAPLVSEPSLTNNAYRPQITGNAHRYCEGIKHLPSLGPPRALPVS